MNLNTALLIIDVQNGLFSIPEAPIFNADKMIANIVELIRKARSCNVPVIYIQHCDESGDLLGPHTPGWDICSVVAPNPDDLLIEKKTPDSFHETRLKEELDKRGVKKLVIVGLQTDFCIDTTCRRAFSLGYEVILVEDGHSTMDSEILSADQIIKHHNAVLGEWFCVVKQAKEIEFE